MRKLFATALAALLCATQVAALPSIRVSKKVTPGDLNTINTPIDGDCVTYDAATGLFEWDTCGGGGSSEWTDGGTFLHPNETADDVIVGAATVALADIFLGGDGAAVFNEQGAAVDFRVETDTVTDTFVVDGSADEVIVNVDFKVENEVIFDPDVAGNGFIRNNTADTVDNLQIQIGGGGLFGTARGGQVDVSGNEHASTGSVSLTAGNVAGGDIIITTSNDAGQVRLETALSGTDNDFIIDNTGFGFTGQAGDDVSIGAGLNIRFNGTTSGVVDLGVAAVAGTWTFTLPTDDGDANELLLTDGGGVTSWSLVDTVSLVDDAVTPDKVLVAGQTDEFCLTYELTGTTWEWQACGSGGGDEVLINGTNVVDALGIDFIEGTNGIDIVHAAVPSPETATFNFDPTEVDSVTWGTGTGDTWTLAASTTSQFSIITSSIDSSVCITAGTAACSSGASTGSYLDLDGDDLGLATLLADATLTMQGGGDTLVLDATSLRYSGPIFRLVENNAVIEYEGAADGFELTIAFDNPSSDKTVTFSDAAGTVAVSATSPASLSVLGDIGIVADSIGSTHIGVDAVGVSEFDDGSDTAASDDVVMIDNGDNTQFIYIAVPDCDNATTSKLLYDVTTQAFSCGTDQNSGSATAIDDLADAGAGDDTVGLAEQGQTWTWDTGDVTAAAFDGLTLVLDYDPSTTDAGNQRLFSLSRPDNAIDAVGAPEAFILIDNLDTNDPVTTAIQVRAAAGGISIVLDANDAQLTTIIEHVGGSVVTGDLDIIDDGQIDDTDMAAESFGEFTCDGTEDGCTIECVDCLDAGHIADIYVLIAGDTMTGTLQLDDGVGDSPSLIFVPATGTSWQLFVDDTSDDVQFFANTASTETVDFVNNGAGVVDVTLDGDLTISGDDLFMGTNTDAFILVADATNFNPVAMSGDITITNAGVTSIGTDAVGVTELDDGADTAASDDVVMIDNGDNTQFIYIAVPDCDNATTSKLLYDVTTQAFTCGTDQDSGGATAIDNLADAGAGDDAVALAEQGQVWTWDSAATAAAYDGLTLAIAHDSTTDSNTQRVLVVQRNETAGTEVVEALVLVTNLDTGLAVTTGIEVTSAAGTMTTGIDLSDSDLVNAGNMGENFVLFTPTTGTIWSQFVENTNDDLQIQVSTASVETMDWSNIGAGTVDITVDGVVFGGSFDCVGAVTCDYGSADITSVTVTTDSTGDGEVVLPDDSIGPDEILAAGQTDEFCLTYEATGDTWEWQACGGGGATPDDVLNFAVAGLFPTDTSDGFCPNETLTATTVETIVGACDASSQEWRNGVFQVPTALSSTGSDTVTFRLKVVAATAAAVNVAASFDHCAVAPDEDLDSCTFTGEDSGAQAISATQNDEFAIEWTETITNLGWVAEDTVYFKIGRELTADTLTGDLFLVHFQVSIPQE